MLAHRDRGEGAGATNADIHPGRCCIGAVAFRGCSASELPARACSGARRGHSAVAQQLWACPDAGKRCRAASNVGADSCAAGADLQRERCLHQRPSHAAGLLWGIVRGPKTLETSSGQVAISDHIRMLANAVAQRVAWVLLPRPLVCSYQWAGGAQNATRVIPVQVGGVGASEIFKSSFALRHRAQMLANAVS